MNAVTANAGIVFFALCSVVCVVGALTTILARNPIRGAVGLLATILGIAGLFLKLNAQFLAAIQLIVYAGAVVVLFVFVIMLLGPDASGGSRGPGKARLSRAVAGALLFGLAAAAMGLLARVSQGPTRLGPVRPEHGTAEAVGGLIFGRGIVPFEITTALLIVAVVGAIAVARGRPGKKVERRTGESEGGFHGPLHPRDAGHPLGRERLG